ncbi:PQQ-dependent sugar dehydrogenase [Parasphingorhabdus pacifica]
MRPPIVFAMLALLVGCGGPGPGTGPGGGSPDRTPPPPAGSTLNAEVVAGGLEHPWAIGFLPGGQALVTERSGRFTLLTGTRPGATARPVDADLGDVRSVGEGGLMGLLVHPDFAENRRFVSCQTHQRGGTTDIRLVNWRLSEDGASAERLGPLLTGLPINSSGRHSGCRLALAEDGSMLVSTGDTARPPVAQDRASLGGKVLRIDPDTGAPVPGNPFLASPEPNERLIWTYGHRNPQGVAPRPGGQVLIAEHGPDVDDEINLLRPGGNYGWDPSRGGASGSYDESVPMTDLRRFPGAVPATWSSGDSTEAVCAATFLTGSRWGRFEGLLAVTALKGSKLMLFELGPDGTTTLNVSVPRELDGEYGRLRAARQGPDGALYVTTSNGSGDRVLRVTNT